MIVTTGGTGPAKRDVTPEATEAVAEVITAKEETELADMLSGISQDQTSQELQEMRELRQNVRAKARISREMAGTDTKAQEAEFIEYARSVGANDEFEQLIGLADDFDSAPAASVADTGDTETRLPGV